MIPDATNLSVTRSEAVMHLDCHHALPTSIHFSMHVVKFWACFPFLASFLIRSVRGFGYAGMLVFAWAGHGQPGLGPPCLIHAACMLF